MQKWIFTLAVTVISRCLILRDRLLGRVRPQGDTDPATAFRSLVVRSGTNLLDARFAAPAEGPVKAAVLLCHGIGETVAHWEAAQRLLAQDGVASLVFNYSGYGKSTGWITSQQCEADALMAFNSLRQLVVAAPLCILGYSLGSGIAIAIAPQLQPSKLILCAAFTSLRRAAASLGVPTPLTHLLPELWDNALGLELSTVPALILHGDADALFPPEMAWQLARRCKSECEVIIVPGLSHNGPIYCPDAEYWSLVTSRL